MSEKWNGTVHHSVGEAKTFPLARAEDGTLVFVHGCCTCGSVHYMVVDPAEGTITTDDMDPHEVATIRGRALTTDPSLFPLLGATEEIADLRAKLARAAADLVLYGVHARGCQVDPERRCSCGFNEACNAAAKPAAPTEEASEEGQ